MAHKYLTRKRTKRNASKSEGALSKESTIPTLPVEIIRMIFELVAFTIPGNLRSLCLVCKMSNLWISPILYRTIVLKTLPKCRLFRRTVNTFSKRPTHTTFLSTHTRALILPSRTIHSIPSATLDAILLSCPNLTTLSCSASLLDDDLSLFPNLHALTHLSLPNLFEYPKILPPSLTHLSCGASVWDFADPPVWRSLFAECPALTHLCLSSEYLKSYGFIDFPLANLISALPLTIHQLIFILVAPDSQWYMVDESVRRMQRRYLAEGEKRVVWMSVDRYGSLCDPLHPGFYAGHILAGKNAVAGVTGMDYPNEKEVDIWDLGRRVARHYASGYKVNGRRVSW